MNIKKYWHMFCHRLLIFWLFLLIHDKCLIVGVEAQSFRKVQLGFPNLWNGDKYSNLHCPAKNIPKFIDGYFFCQLSASYGDSKAEPGKRLNHMIDAIGAIASFHISNGEVKFSAQYYPSRPYKIWEFYDRNFSKASVPWAGWSDYNLTAMNKWEQIPANQDSARFHPNLDFWRVGKKLIAGTEAPYWIGYEFDVQNLSNFKLFPFKEENEIFGKPKPNLIPISMAIHERMDSEDNGGLIWGSFSAMNFNEQRFYQGIFTIDKNGVRRVVGMYDYGVWDSEACGKNDEYIGDKTLLPGYIHSITSTENFIILPITSLLINPCKFKEPPLTNPESPIQNGGLWGMDFYDMVPMRFLIFNKRTLVWITEKPLEVFPSMFVTHQLNAYETTDGKLLADMVVYDSHDPYIKYFYTDFLTSQLYPSTARILRFTLDIVDFKVMYNYLIPQETIAADFPQINHAYDGLPYQWAYIVEHPFAGDNTLIKLNVDDPTGRYNLRYTAEPHMVLHEPWFIAKPSPKREDDGILLIKALDLAQDKGVLFIIDALTMSEIGRAYVPISVPFGFHNRFYSSDDLGLPNSEYNQRIINNNRIQRPYSWIVSPQLPQPPVDYSGQSKEFWSRLSSSTQKMPTWVPIQPIQPLVTSNTLWWLTTTTTTTQKPSLPNSRLNRPHSRPQPIMPRIIHPQPEESINIVIEQPLLPPTTTINNLIVDEYGPNEPAIPIRKLYEKALRALCHLLPKLFKSVTFENCIEGGKNTVKWMTPNKRNYPKNLITSENNSPYQGDYILRPTLSPTQIRKTPWYNYRSYIQTSSNNKKKI